MCGDRFSASTTCSGWRHETEPARLDQSRSCRFWKVATPPRTLADFQASYNEVLSHASLRGHTPLTFAGGHTVARAELNTVRWVSHCRDLVQLPVAA